MDHPRRQLAHWQAKVAAEANNATAWFNLGWWTNKAGLYTQAVKAYEAILLAEPDNGKVVAELAQAKFLLANNALTPEVSGLVARALDLEPSDPTALGLAGIEAFGQRRYQQAMDYWRQAIEVLGPRSSGIEALQGGIEAAPPGLGRHQPGTRPAEHRAHHVRRRHH